MSRPAILSIICALFLTISNCFSVLQEYAPGFYNLLVYIKETYNNPVIYVTENGKNTGAGFQDDARVGYLRNYISAMLGAIKSGVNIKGYFPWNLMDDFEWDSGYTLKYGLYEIDMTDPERKRVPRYSSYIYREIIRSRTVDYNYEPDLNAFSKGCDKTVMNIILFITIVVNYFIY